MTYTPTTWVDNSTVANAAAMNNIENGIVAAGGSSLPVPNSSLFISGNQYPCMLDGNSDASPVADTIHLIPTFAPFSRSINKVTVKVTNAATTATLVEIAIYDASTLALVSSCGTITMTTAGGTQMAIGSTITVPPWALVATKLRAASLNSGTLRSGVADQDAAWLIVRSGNPWDDPSSSQPYVITCPDTGTGAMPSTLVGKTFSYSTKQAAFVGFDTP